MKISNKLAAMLAFVAIMSGGHQTLWAAPILPGPVPVIGDSLKQFQKTIPRQQRNFDDVEKPHPGYDSTLLMNQTVHFAWDEEVTGYFVITDAQGVRIFETALDGKSSLDIVPAEAKLNAGEKYSWSIDGVNKYEFTILDEQTEKALLEKLYEIEAAYPSQTECAVYKSIYVQKLSEDYPDTFDLYWLSAQWLLTISPNDKQLKVERGHLLENYSAHFLLKKGEHL